MSINVNKVELKTVVVQNREIINVGEWDFQIAEIDGVEVAQNPLPPGAVIEQREMFYTPENGYREVGWEPEPTAQEKLQADIKYLSIMTGVEI